jgi:hypothetical protein
MAPSYESVRAELDEIVERYRLGRDGGKGTLTREEAVERICRLGFARGDAMRWLDKKPRGVDRN